MIRNGKVGDVVQVLVESPLVLADSPVSHTSYIFGPDPVIGIINRVEKHNNWTEYTVILQPPSSGEYSGSAREFKRAKVHIAEWTLHKMGGRWGLFKDDLKKAIFDDEWLARWVLDNIDDWRMLDE